MVTALVVAFVFLLIAAIAYMEAGDLIRERFASGRAGPEEDMSLPILVLPLAPGRGDGGGTGDGPVGAPATHWGPPLVQWSGGASALRPELDGDGYDHPDGATIVFRRPLDEPVQLPGRLKILSGEVGREEIRFVGSVGERPQIVIGREGGPPNRVITLQSPTVSRRHAQMEFVDGKWRIANLSRTNPVMVNDEILSPGRGVVRTLADGDRIELGEVVLRFSAR